MKEKDLSWIHLQEVMAAIQTFLEQEEAESKDDWASAFHIPIPEKRGLEGLREGNPQTLHIVQYFLAKHENNLNRQYLMNMPAELFVVC
jgi:hypothetical protein